MIEPTVESLFDSKIIDLNIEANTKEDVINHLTDLLFEEGYLDDKGSYIKDIYYRESLGITGMGDNVAIPHGKSASVKKTGLAIGKTKSMIPWESYDNQPVNIIFLFAVPDNPNGSETHLRLLADVACKLGNDEILEKVKSSENVSDLKDALFK